MTVVRVGFCRLAAADMRNWSRGLSCFSRGVMGAMGLGDIGSFSSAAFSGAWLGSGARFLVARLSAGASCPLRALPFTNTCRGVGYSLKIVPSIPGYIRGSLVLVVVGEGGGAGMVQHELASMVNLGYWVEEEGERLNTFPRRVRQVPFPSQQFASLSVASDGLLHPHTHTHSV